jgi:hypothetical protein
MNLLSKVVFMIQEKRFGLSAAQQSDTSSLLDAGFKLLPQPKPGPSAAEAMTATPLRSDPLRKFSDICRAELEFMQSQI